MTPHATVVALPIKSMFTAWHDNLIETLDDLCREDDQSGRIRSCVELWGAAIAIIGYIPGIRPPHHAPNAEAEPSEPRVG